jgi:hypothetical protein
MAEEATKQKPADKTNWADMDNDEDDDQEIGVQGGATNEAKTEEEKKEGGAATEENAEGAEGKTHGYSKRPRKDYGDKYDPNYKKKIWSKGGAQYNKDKNMAPAIPRSKNERGDYVVTSFSIPDRADKIKAAAGE